MKTPSMRTHNAFNAPSRERGAALLLVLILLVGALALGLATLQAAMVTSRLAGSHGALIQAQARAERAAYYALANFDTFSWVGAIEIKESDDAPTWREAIVEPKSQRPPSLCEQSGCLLLPVHIEGYAWVMTLGAVTEEDSARVIAASAPIFVRVEDVVEGEREYRRAVWQ